MLFIIYNFIYKVIIVYIYIYIHYVRLIGHNFVDECISYSIMTFNDIYCHKK